MSEIVMETVWLLEMLPEEEKNFAYEMVKRLVLAWDPDYTKVTPKEAKELAEAEASGYIAEEDIDWDNLEEMFDD
ncbi:MAG: hypothetical protein J6M38_12560 [Lentisphaeria bacterium]|nr:hypothetical protein [Lentisphaeria bacterium]